MHNSTTTHYLVLKELAGNPPPTLGTIQRLLEPYAHSLVVFWFCVWICVAIFILQKFVRTLMRYKNTR